MSAEEQEQSELDSECHQAEMSMLGTQNLMQEESKAGDAQSSRPIANVTLSGDLSNQAIRQG